MSVEGKCVVRSYEEIDRPGEEDDGPETIIKK
jgi:hypothetical protein